MKTSALIAAVLFLLQLANAEQQTNAAVAPNLAENKGAEALVSKNEGNVAATTIQQEVKVVPSRLARRILRRGNLCRRTIRSTCGRRCNRLCLNQCYIKNMARFNDIPGCVNAQGRLPGAVVGDDDRDNDGLRNFEDPDDDNDGIRDSEDEDDDNDGVLDSADEDDDNDGIKDVIDNDGDKDSEDGDGDGIADVVDSDDDNDGLSDSDDDDDDNDGTNDTEDDSASDDDSDSGRRRALRGSQRLRLVRL